jgi:energy-coupling factor transporter ATP-binding protein EcfA2
MARAEASVVAPPATADPVFAPYPLLRAPQRDGAALSLRLFAEGPEDATAFVLRAAPSLSLSPIPPRAAALFEAHAAALARGDDDALVVGFPLVTFVVHGQRRAAPLLLWRGARASWRADSKPWTVPPDARPGAPLSVPTGLVLHAPDPDDDAPALELHAGLWRQLMDADGAGPGACALPPDATPGRCVAAVQRWLTRGPDDALDDAEPDDAPEEEALTRAALVALVEAVHSRAPASLGLQAHPHALVMLLPRGDPTSGLRAELTALLRAPPPQQGPLAVYLGSQGRPPQEAPVWAHGASPPTPSQLATARVLEGSRDLVALCGPPGCGKTTLLHHLAAQAVVARALEDTWTKPPGPMCPWALVVVSTNNAAVDHALAPFVAGRSLPVGVRLGNRLTLARDTAEALRLARDALVAAQGPTLAEARAAFEAHARPVREYLRDRTNAAESERSRAREYEALTARREALRSLLAGPLPEVDESVEPAQVADARAALREHAHAATLVGPTHLRGAQPSIARAREKWAKANALRGRVIRPVLGRLGMEVPFADLGAEGDLEGALEAQRVAMLRTLDALDAVERALRAPVHQRELVRVEAALTALESVPTEATVPTPDPALVEAALVLRDAWARTHRDALLSRLDEAIASVTDERAAAKGKSLADALAALSALFPLAGCTLLSMRASFALDAGVIDRLVVDEAGQCAPIYAVPALARARRALVTGDVAQLPPVYTLDDRVDARLARGLDTAATEPFRMGASAFTSAQAVAESRAEAPRALVEHFRSQPAIVALASAWSGYTLDVRTAPRSMVHTSPRLSQAVRVVHVAGRGVRAPEGVVNEAEAARAVALVEALVADGVSPRDVAVLTPFVGQSARIERALLGRGLVHGEGGARAHRAQAPGRRAARGGVFAHRDRAPAFALGCRAPAPSPRGDEPRARPPRRAA